MAGCRHFDGATECGATPTRRYLPGDRCAAHTPAALAGREDLVPDPTRTLEALRVKAGVAFHYNRNDTSLNDERAIASGRRRANANAYRAARAAEEQRKAARR